MNKIWFSLLLMLACYVPALGQSYIQNTMYDYTRFLYNPATAGFNHAGTNQGWTLGSLGRQQWVGIDGSPRLVSLTGHRYFDGFGSIGGTLLQDQLGPFTSTSVNLAYGFPLQLGPESHLSLGISGGFSQRALNFQVIAIDPGDQVIVDPGNFLSNSTGAFNLSAGVFYQSRKDGFEKFFIGLSGQDLLEPSLEALTFAPNTGEISNIPRSFYLTSGYKIPIGYWAGTNYNYIQPTVMLRMHGSVFQSDISLYAKISALRFGLNYRGVAYAFSERGSESFGGILGFDVSEELFFGYSYDLNISGLNANGDASSHEIVLTYRFPAP
ncbi:MAG: PorP/SprF family type IX secretion system membrane protein, partial [Bacteroidia bacterium]